MTKTELIEEVSRVVEMTQKDSQVIVEAIWTVWCALYALGIGSKAGVLEASVRANAGRGWGAIRKRARAWKFRI